MMKYLRFFLRIPSTFFLLLLTWISVQYIICPIYNYPGCEPFHGDKWYNPYQDMEGSWLKGNFQVQSFAWFGMTDGRDKTEQVYDHYKSLGYDIITISDYQYINRFDDLDIGFISVYEHGYNARKAHHVVIGAKRVEWCDYHFWQNRDHKQHLLTLLRKSGDFIVIAHPTFMNAFSTEDMQNLLEYDAIEVLNHYRNSKKLWDAALTSGKPVWIISNDDSHNINDSSQTGVCWTMINAPSTNQDDVLTALKAGHMYGVSGKHAINHAFPEKVTVDNDILKVRFTEQCREIRFIGTEGVVRKTCRETPQAEMRLTDRDTYIRVEADVEDNILYLNPVLRWDGKQLPEHAAIIDTTYTFLQYGIWAVIIFGWIFYKVNLKYLRKRQYYTEIDPEFT